MNRSTKGATHLALILVVIGAFSVTACSLSGTYIVPTGGSSTHPWKITGQEGISADTARTVAMVLDGSGNPYVAYADDAYGDELTVLHYNGTTWGPVAPLNSLGPTITSQSVNAVALAIDASGNPYVAYVSSSGSLYVEQLAGGAWTPLPGGNPLSTGLNYGTISMAASGTNLYVAFSASSGPTGGITCEEWNGSSWKVLGGAGSFPASVGSDLSLAVDSSGTPYVAFIDGTNNGDPSVMSYNGTAWTSVGAAPLASTPAGAVALAISGGTPAIAFLPPPPTGPSPTSGTVNGPPTVMTYSAGAWQAAGGSNLADAATYQQGVDLVTLNGTLYLAYYGQVTTGTNRGTEVLVYSGSGGSWTAYPVGNMQAPFSLAVDSSGNPVVAYADNNVHSRLTVATP